MKIKVKKGLSIAELLIGLTIGIVVLSVLMAFFMNSSKMIESEQRFVKDSSHLQFLMNRIAEDIKNCNTVPPTTITNISLSDWAGLPSMCYSRPFNTALNNPICQPASSSYPKELPTYPTAYLYQSQAGLTSTPNGWYPKQQTLTQESNQLGFYKVSNGLINRVLYYIEQDPAYPASQEVYILKRKEQLNVATSSDKYEDILLQSNITTVVSGVKYAKFTYPALEKKLEPTSTEYDANFFTKINDVNTNEADVSKRPYVQSVFLNDFRNIIGIKISIAGPISKATNKRVEAFGLYTEVNIRN
ncbi:MAG: hypothetical protein AABZ74_02730 [Cyanobacteriota bacterium]